MKVGCLGCLSVIVLALSLLALSGGMLWVWGSIQAIPSLLPASPSKADPATVERRVAELGFRRGGRPTGMEPLVFNESEVAVFLSRHLEDAGLWLTIRMR